MRLCAIDCSQKNRKSWIGTYRYTSLLSLNWRRNCNRQMLVYLENCRTQLQSLYYETGQTVLFWDILWPKNFVFMNCETYLALEYAHKPTWPTGFEKSEIHQPNLEKLQFKGSRIEAFLLDFEGKCEKLPKNAPILLPENCNFSR